MALTRTITQTHRHYHDKKLSPVDLDVARILGLPLIAECREVWIPGTAEESAPLPMCPDCARLNEEPRRHGAHRTPIEIRREFPHYVYRYYNAADELLYVGCTYNPVARLKQHRGEGKAWALMVARTRLTVWPNRRKALDMERLAIETEHPIHNLAFKQSAS